MLSHRCVLAIVLCLVFGLQACGGGFRRRHRAFDPMLDLAELIDEKIRGGAGADADQRAVDHVIDGGTRNRLLEFVLSHGRFTLKGIRYFNG